MGRYGTRTCLRTIATGSIFFDSTEGTMGPENPDILLDQGSLYSFEPFNKFEPVKQLSPVSISNGLAWNKNDTLMYYIDSPTRNVDVFDFDILKGTIGKPLD